LGGKKERVRSAFTNIFGTRRKIYERVGEQEKGTRGSPMSCKGKESKNMVKGGKKRGKL